MCAILALAALSACGRDDGPAETVDRDAVSATFVAGEFGDGVDPSRVIATAGDLEITASDVAVYLDLYPQLTVGQAVEDLVDLRLAAGEARAREVSLTDIATLDGQTRGLVFAWLSTHFWTDPALHEPDPERVTEALENPDLTEHFGLPALARTSHLLFRVSDEGTEDDRAEARRQADAWMTRLQATGEQVTSADFEAAVEELTPKLEGTALSVITDSSFSFPRRYAGYPRWEGVSAVADEFADAAFSAEAGALVRADTEFGSHIILVEERLPAEMLPEEDQQRIAEQLVVAFQVGEAIAAAISTLTDDATIRRYPANLQRLADESVEQLRGASEDRYEDFR